MSRVVLDSSILLASVLPDEPLSEQAQACLLSWAQSGTQVIAPRLFRSELVAVIRKAVFQQRISHEQGRRYLARVLVSPVEFHDDDALLTSAYEMAARFNLPRAYDAQYLALAERFDCDFWTADKTLHNSLHASFSRIRWLGNFMSSS